MLNKKDFVNYVTKQDNTLEQNQIFLQNPLSCFEFEKKKEIELIDYTLKEVNQKTSGLIIQLENCQQDNNGQIFFQDFFADNDQSLLEQLQEIVGDICQIEQNMVQSKESDQMKGNQNQSQGRSMMTIQKNQKLKQNNQHIEEERQIIDILSNPQEQKQRKDETKNTIKNFIKALIAMLDDTKYGIDNRIKNLAEKELKNKSYDDFKKQLIQKKKQISTIGAFKKLLTDQETGKFFRIIFQFFLRKYCPRWVFNSKVQTIKAHLNNRRMLRQLIKNPYNMNRLKKD